MRHRIHGKQLSRNGAHRKALRRNMAASLFEHGAIRTTVIKAKELKPFVEHLITVAREGTLAARRRVISILRQDKGRMFILYPALRSYEDAILPKELASVSGLARDCPA